MVRVWVEACCVDCDEETAREREVDCRVVDGDEDDGMPDALDVEECCEEVSNKEAEDSLECIESGAVVMSTNVDVVGLL